VLIHFVAMAAHAFFGVILLQSTTVLAPDWWAPVHPTWAASLLADQHLGAGIAWAFGEIPAAVVFVVLVAQWIRADEREQARADRAADRAETTGEDDDLARYNAFLRQAARTGFRQGSTVDKVGADNADMVDADMVDAGGDRVGGGRVARGDAEASGTGQRSDGCGERSH
jgi:hypothetical protein